MTKKFTGDTRMQDSVMSNNINSQEKESVYKINVTMSDLDSKKYLKPSSYLRLINSIIEEHLITYGVDAFSIAKYNLGWVLISTSVNIIDPIKEPQTLYARTWHTESNKASFRRDGSFVNEKGEVVFEFATYTALLNLDTHTIFRKKELPFYLSPGTKEALFPASPSYKQKHDYIIVHDRKVFRSHLDCLGHVNNSNYGDFAYDALSEDEAKLENISKIEIFFSAELQENESFRSIKAHNGNKTIVSAIKENEKHSYYAVFTYKSDI